MATKKFFVAVLLCIAMQHSFGQQTNAPLKVGDRLPDLTINNILNRSGNTVKLSDLHKDGLLVIDFWATWCIPCIGEMKYLDSLKSRHPGKFNALMVTYENPEVIQKFFNKSSNTDIKTANLYLASADTLLSKLFPHKGIPHNIWIDKNGVIRNITGGDQVKEDNILNFESRTAYLRTKADKLSFDMMKEFHLGDSVFSYRSLVSPYMAGISSGSFGIATRDSVTRYLSTNSSLLHLYWAAFSDFVPSVRYNLMEVQTKDSLKFYHPSGHYKHLLKESAYKDYNDWATANIWCYALTLPKPVSKDKFKQYMYEDFERQFNVRAHEEIRMIPCTVVHKKRGKTFGPVSSGAQPLPVMLASNFLLKIRDASIEQVTDWIYRTYKGSIVPLPFVIKPDTDTREKFDLDLDFSGVRDVENGINPEMIYKKLETYGFRFEIGKHPYTVLVLRDLR